MSKLICIKTTKCLRGKNTTTIKDRTYFYDTNKIKSNGEIYLYVGPIDFKNKFWGYLGIFDIKNFLTDQEYKEYKRREKIINEILKND